ncbi:MAG: AraC family transcriptional regulator [Lachnospiraceae bacterium]|nr:AraC family transcriptional regulator [Lachnospiraceae bacterium]
MKIFCFDLSEPFRYHWAGKFRSPNAEWMHLTRRLSDFELIVVTNGTLYIADGLVEYTVRTGEYLLMAPTPAQHGSRPSDCSFGWLHFAAPENWSTLESAPTSGRPPASVSVPPRQASSGSAPTRQAASGSAPARQADDTLLLPEQGELKSIERIVVLMKQLQDSDRRYGMGRLNDSLTSVILCEISAQSLLPAKYTKDGAEQLFQDISYYINWHVCENLRVAEIADYFGYNEKYLSTLFRKWSGSSIKQFIVQTKMDHAKAELCETNHSVAQIGYSIGYSDPHNFSNAFKKATGLTPGEYRSAYAKHRLFYQ